MALAIATNTGALMAAASASSVNKDMETSMERLSTGKRINSAADDAAGVAIASRLSSEIRGTNQAIRNAQDGQALINTAEGAHKEVENILQRMRELAVQAANDTNDTTDRSNLQLEFDQLVDEIDRIAEVTTWAGQNLLGATGAGVTNDFTFHIGAGNTVGSDSIEVKIGNVRTDNGILGDISQYKASSTAGSIPAITFGLFEADGTTAEDVYSVSVTGGEILVDKDESGSTTLGTITMNVTVGGDTSVIDITPPGTLSKENIATAIADALSSEALNLGISIDTTAADAGKVTIASTTNSTGNGGLMTSSDAQGVIGNLDTAIKNLNSQRAELGAVSNRLDNTVSNLTNVVINLEGGKGRIEDADFAAESTSLAKSQILQQASTAMLAQANASKQNVLSLLQG